VFDYAERRRRVAERMEAEGIDVLFLAPSADLEYLTGIRRDLPSFGESSYAHGWVTGATRVANVELFIDGSSQGVVNFFGPDRIDIPSTTPVQAWRVGVNLDNTTRGDHVLRAVGTDLSGNKRQFASQRVFFAGPGANCFIRRRSTTTSR